jgi:hypothetical protein
VIACVSTNPELFGKGAIAQLGERYNGIVEVVGSIPIGSTKQEKKYLYAKIAR